MDMTLGVLVAFYLFLAVRWDLVHRTLPYVVGVCAVGVAILSRVFVLDGRLAAIVFSTLGILVAFGAGIATCCQEKLPVIDADSMSTDGPEIL